MPRPPRDLEVADEQEYVEDGLGPPEDTDVFSKADGAAASAPPPSDVRPPNRPEARADDPMRSLRRPVRYPDRKVPWLGLGVGLVTAAVVAFTLVVVFGFVLSGAIGDDPSAAGAGPATAPGGEAATQPPDEIQGVKVRRGLKRGAGEELPPKRRRDE